jgi:hypothetical protein
MRDDDSKIADAELIMRFFAGDGTTNYRFPKPDSPEELKARGALARVVRDYVPGFSGELLALAIDPDTPSRFVGMAPTRKVKFESVNRGRPAAWRRNVRVAEFIRRQLAECDQHEAAYAAAAAKFRISRSTAQSIWQWRVDAMQDAKHRELWRARN